MTSLVLSLDTRSPEKAASTEGIERKPYGRHRNPAYEREDFEGQHLTHGDNSFYYMQSLASKISGMSINDR